jgi:hypothetical protein
VVAVADNESGFGVCDARGVGVAARGVGVGSGEPGRGDAVGAAEAGRGEGLGVGVAGRSEGLGEGVAAADAAGARAGAPQSKPAHSTRVSCCREVIGRR